MNGCYHYGLNGAMHKYHTWYCRTRITSPERLFVLCMLAVVFAILPHGSFQAACSRSKKEGNLYGAPLDAFGDSVYVIVSKNRMGNICLV